MDIRDQVGYLIYHFDDTIDGDRTRDQYLECADQILELLGVNGSVAPPRTTTDVIDSRE
ncbi:hypothetical protein AB0J14_04795 [Micromonospora arborensis]|uniref:hypothetical protein n=1 Tax=Micromonospora arborensis TaxID=2116518 RepID=UPI0033D1F0B5